MWDEIKEKIKILERLDKTKQVFGSKTHQYKFGTPLKEEEINSWEKEHNVHLPNNLRGYYLECGDGGAGPYYGMKKLVEIGCYNPDKSFLDEKFLIELAKKKHGTNKGDDDEYYYENDNTWGVAEYDYQGLVSIIEYGCGDEICLVTNSEKKGQVVLKTEDYGMPKLGSLKKEFNRWLDEELTRFDLVKDLMTNCESANELDKICRKEHNFYHGQDYMVSYIGAIKPVKLFGKNENTFHGATQFPWYEKQFLEFKQKKKKFWFF